MIKLNTIGAQLAQLDCVHAMTDVTGFGLLGHLREMMEASGTSAQVHFDQVPLLDSEAIHHYLSVGAIPGGTKRNFASYGDKISPLTDTQQHILCDPQTSGGLLVSVAASEVDTFLAFCDRFGERPSRVGTVLEEREKLVMVG